ncbi:MAG: HD domain-containing protein [Acholeplasmataceae bacterium]|nr:HD domain-containing protein [Acholeplasmataceae bacterium]
MNTSLKTYLETNIIKMYESFDLAHQPNHVYTVIENSILIAKDYEVNSDMVFTIACYHDIGMQFGRKDHHLTGGQFLFNDQFLVKYFDDDQRIIMKEAIEDHRASGKEPPRSIYGKIIAEADRDINPDIVIERTVQFGFKHYPNLSKAEHVERAMSHIKEKYGPNGYLKLWLKTKKNQDGLDQIHHLLKQPKKLKSIIENHYKEFNKNL